MKNYCVIWLEIFSRTIQDELTEQQFYKGDENSLIFGVSFGFANPCTKPPVASSVSSFSRLLLCVFIRLFLLWHLLLSAKKKYFLKTKEVR